MRRGLPIFIVLIGLFLSGCSIINNFVIINASDGEVEVSYTTRWFTGDLPQSLPASELGKHAAWQSLSAGRYNVGPSRGGVFLNLLGAAEGALIRAAKLSKGRDQEAAEDFKKAIDLDASLKELIEKLANEIAQKRNTPPKP